MHHLPFAEYPFFAQVCLLLMCAILCLATFAAVALIVAFVFLPPKTAREFSGFLARIIPSIFDRNLFRSLKLQMIKKERRYSA